MDAHWTSVVRTIKQQYTERISFRVAEHLRLPIESVMWGRVWDLVLTKTENDMYMRLHQQQQQSIHEITHYHS